MGNQIAGPNVGANGQEELANPGATLAPNEAQYRDLAGSDRHEVPDGARVQSAVRLHASPSTCRRPRRRPSPGSKATSAPTASPTPTPQPSASSDDSDDSDDDSDAAADAGGMITHAGRAAAARRAEHDESQPDLHARHAARCDPLAEQHGFHAQRRHVGAVHASGDAVHAAAYSRCSSTTKRPCAENAWTNRFSGTYTEVHDAAEQHRSVSRSTCRERYRSGTRRSGCSRCTARRFRPARRRRPRRRPLRPRPPPAHPNAPRPHHVTLSGVEG